MNVSGLAFDYHADRIVELISRRPTQSWAAPILSLVCPCIDRVFIKLPSFPWKYMALALNDSMPLEFFKTTVAPDSYRKYTGGRKDLSFQEVLDSVDHPDWDWWFISKNNYCVYSLELVEEYPELPWDVKGLVCNETIASEPRFFQSFLKNQTLTPETWAELSWLTPIAYIKEYPDLPWIQNIIQIRFAIPNIPSESEKNFATDLNNILNNPNNGWDWDLIITRHDMNMNIISTYCNIPWNMSICKEYFPTPHDIQSNDDWMPIQNETTIKSLFAFDSDIEEFARKHMAAWKIQQAFLRAYYNPSMLICQKRIMSWANENTYDAGINSYIILGK